MHAISDAVAAVCPAVELVDDRHADYKKLEVISLVADNSWNGGIVLGDFSANWPDLVTIVGVVRRNGVEVDRGLGRDVLGHPFEPLTWLANHLARTGDALRAGDIVLTGSLVTTRFPTETEAYAFELAGLGTVEVTVTT
jgi:2-keto-4-pentenoate hydratase